MWHAWVRRWGSIGSWWGNRREGDHWGDLGVDGRIILGWISQEVGCGCDWIGLAQDRDRWRTLVSAVMNLWAPWNAGNFLTSCRPVSFSRRNLRHGISKGHHVGITQRYSNIPNPLITTDTKICCATKTFKAQMPKGLPVITTQDEGHYVISLELEQWKRASRCRDILDTS